MKPMYLSKFCFHVLFNIPESFTRPLFTILSQSIKQTIGHPCLSIIEERGYSNSFADVNIVGVQDIWSKYSHALVLKNFMAGMIFRYMIFMICHLIPNMIDWVPLLYHVFQWGRPYPAIFPWEIFVEQRNISSLLKVRSTLKYDCGRFFHEVHLVRMQKFVLFLVTWVGCRRDIVDMYKNITTRIDRQNVFPNRWQNNIFEVLGQSKKK